MNNTDTFSPSREERAAIAEELGIKKCDHCLKFCPFCPRLLAVRPDLGWGPPSDQQAPSLLRKAVNLSKAAAQHVAAGLPHADEETVRHRLEVCHTCNHFDASHEACRLCGCNMPLKVRWAEQQCPIKKW